MFNPLDDVLLLLLTCWIPEAGRRRLFHFLFLVRTWSAHVVGLRTEVSRKIDGATVLNSLKQSRDCWWSNVKLAVIGQD